MEMRGKYLAGSGMEHCSKMQIKSVWWREVQMMPVCWQSMQMRQQHGCMGEKCSGIRMRQPKQLHPEKSC